MRNLHDEFLYRKIQQPSRPLAWLVCMAMRAVCKINRVTFSYDEDYLQMQKEQMLILCQHQSRRDYIYVFAGLKGYNYHTLCGYQNVFQPVLYTLFKKLGIIAKMLYQPDAHATMQMLRAVRQGSSIVLFPEGIQSTSGSTHPINPATMKLLEKLKLPVAMVTLEGAYFARPRYCADVKKGQVTVRFQKLFDRDDFTRFSREELYDRLLERFRYNAFSRTQRIAFRGKQPNISGLDNILYQCPDCLGEHVLSVRDEQLQCSRCGFAITMDDCYDITAVSGTLPFANIDAWYKWQRRQVAQQVVSDTFQMRAKVKIGRINVHKLGPNYSLEYYGEGELLLTNQGLTYQGTRDGTYETLFFQAKQVYSLTMSLAYDLDLYYDGSYYNFKLLENEKQAVKWMLAAEEIHNLHDPVWHRVSREVYDAE